LQQRAEQTRLPNQRESQPHGIRTKFIEFRLPSSVDSIRENISQCLTRGHGQGVVRISNGLPSNVQTLATTTY